MLPPTRGSGYFSNVNAVLENPERVWTYEDYLALNDDTVFEIINGKAFMSPAPELFHQRWARKIFLACGPIYGLPDLVTVWIRLCRSFVRRAAGTFRRSVYPSTVS